MIKREQKRSESTERFMNDKEQLNLQKNEKGLYICKGKIEGEYPVYLPEKSAISEK